MGSHPQISQRSVPQWAENAHNSLRRWVHSSCLFLGGFATLEEIFGVLVSPLTLCPPPPKQVCTPRFQTTQYLGGLRTLNTHYIDGSSTPIDFLGGLGVFFGGHNSHLFSGGLWGSFWVSLDPQAALYPQISQHLLSEQAENVQHQWIHDSHFFLGGF